MIVPCMAQSTVTVPAFSAWAAEQICRVLVVERVTSRVGLGLDYRPSVATR